MLPSPPLARLSVRRTPLVPEVLPAERDTDEPAVVPFPLRLGVLPPDPGAATRYRAVVPTRRGLLLDLYG